MTRHQDKLDEVSEFRAQLKNMTDDTLQDQLKFQSVEWRWNSMADELNLRRKTRRLAKQETTCP